MMPAAAVRFNDVDTGPRGPENPASRAPEGKADRLARPIVNPLVDVQNVIRTYQVGRTKVHALDGVTLQIPREGAVAIVGRSGSGKSTLLHVLGGLEKPSVGWVHVDGTSLGDLRGDQLARYRLQTVGFVFQSFHLVPHLSVLENVALPMMLAGEGLLARRRRAKELLDRTGLAERARHRPSELSGGERQRVAVARALANRPKLLLADEPTGNLDTKTADEIMGLIKEECRHAGATLVLVTHERDVAEDYAERMVELRDGRVLEERDLEPRADRRGPEAEPQASPEGSEPSAASPEGSEPSAATSEASKESSS